jgi:NTP pyrophosphatase (non-canonical NTP hydrolase)
MEFAQYQERAIKTAIYNKEHSIIYPALGLANEAGEVLGKLKKVLRDNNGGYTTEHINAIGSEIGDTLWYMAALCRDLGLNMNDIANENLRKLEDRQNRGVLSGSGDTR